MRAEKYKYNNETPGQHRTLTTTEIFRILEGEIKRIDGKCSLDISQEIILDKCLQLIAGELLHPGSIKRKLQQMIVRARP